MPLIRRVPWTVQPSAGQRFASRRLPGLVGFWHWPHLYVRDSLTGIYGSIADPTNVALVAGSQGQGPASTSGTIGRYLDSGRLLSELGISGSANRTIFGAVAFDAINTSAVFQAGIPSTGQDWSLRKLSTGGSFRFNIWGVVAIDFTYALNHGDLLAYACIQRGTAVEIWLNGALRASGTATISTSDATLKFGGGFYSSWISPQYFGGAANVAWSQATAQAFTARPFETAFELRRIIIPVSAGAGGGISGTLSQTFNALTSTATGTLALSGTASQTLSALTSAATGAIAIAGTASPTLAAVTSAATGAIALKGTTTQTLAALTLVGTGQLQMAGTGVLTQALADATLTGAGTLALKGTATQTLGALTLSASGVSGSLTVGTLSATLADVTASATGRCNIAASLGITLGDLTVSGAGRLQIAGVVNATLQAATLSAYETAATVVVEIYRASSPITTSRGMGSPIITSRTLASTIDLDTP